jgi:6-phosphofructokinase
MSSGKILVAQGGGPTAVINQSLVGVVLEARRFREVTRVYGARHGVRGVVNEDFVDLTQETSHNLELVAGTPAAALGSTRDKPDLAYCRAMFEVLRAHQIEHFFNIGGNDSADTTRIVDDEARQAGYPLRCIHIPKTIDNDLVGNDHTPGFPSAARFVAQAFAGANLDNAALPGVYVGVVMGRHAGFLTAASALGKKFPDDGPHLIYVPERIFELGRFLADVKAVHERHGRCVIAVSEGIHDASGQSVVEQLAKDLERDAHGNVQLSGTGALADLLCDQIRRQAEDQARARRHLRLPAAQLRRLRQRRRPARGARGRREGGAIRASGATAAARWPSSAPASIRPTTSWCRWTRWPARRARWKTNSSPPAAPTSPTPSACTCGRCWVRACPMPTGCAGRGSRTLAATPADPRR